MSAVSRLLAITTLLFLSSVAPAHSQLRFGVSGEINRASFGGVAPEHAEYTSNYGTGFAAIIEYRIHRDVVLSLQPGWTQKGAGIVFNRDEEPDSAVTFSVEQSWVTIPVYFRIDSDDRGFYAGGGLSVDLLLDSKLEHEGTTIDNKFVFEDVDFVYQFAAGYMHEYGKRSLFVEARYLQGLETIASTQDSPIGAIYVADFKSTGFKLVAGLLF